jgi:hypothetical protein
MPQSLVRHLALLLCVIAGGAVVWAQTPTISVMQRAQVRQMLRTVREAVKDKYYDPKFHGLDVVEHFKAAEKRLDTVESIGRGYSIIAQSLIEFGDSHTFFIPPEVTASFEYGWQVAMVGDQCLVVGVKPGSDAEAKGLRAGDRLAPSRLRRRSRHARERFASTSRA